MENNGDKSPCIKLPDHERNILFQILDKIISNIKDKVLLETRYTTTILSIETVINNNVKISVVLLSILSGILAIQSKILYDTIKTKYALIAPKLYPELYTDLAITTTCIIIGIIAVLLYIDYKVISLSKNKDKIKKSLRKDIETYDTAIKQLSSIYEAITAKYKSSKLCSPDKELIDYIENLIGKRTD